RLRAFAAEVDMRSLTRSLAPVLVAALVAVACNAPRASSSATPAATGTPNFTGRTLNIVTGGTGAVYIVYGAGLAALLNKKLGTARIANRSFEAYGIDAGKDIDRQRLGAPDSANALRDGKIGAFFFSGGLPVPAILDISASMKIKMLDLSDSVQKMSAKYGNFYFPIKIPKTTYNTAADVMVSGVANLLVVPSSFDPALAQAILAPMFDNKADLVKVHVAANDLTLETATVGSPIDFHQGAIDYYK